jgi:hypothetical protein
LFGDHGHGLWPTQPAPNFDRARDWTAFPIDPHQRETFSQEGPDRQETDYFRPAREQEGLKRRVRQFPRGRRWMYAASASLGKLSAQDWSRGMYKHLDHHLRQFGE